MKKIILIFLCVIVAIPVIMWIRSPILKKEGVPVSVYYQSHRWFLNPDQIVIEWKNGDISCYPLGVMKRSHLIKTGKKIRIYHYYHGITHHYSWEEY